MRIIIFGGGGMIGSEIVKSCLNHDHEVIAICRSRKSMTKAQSLGCETLMGDITKPDSYQEILEKADAVIDAVGSGLYNRITNRKATAMGNVQLEWSKRLIKACLLAEIPRLVLTVGTHLFIPANSDDWAVETNSPLFRGFARTMMDIWPEYERLCRESGIVVRCHPGFVYGPGSWFQNQLVAGIKRWGRPLMIGNGLNYCPYIHSKDVGEGYRLVAERGESGQDYIFAAEPARQIDFTNLASHLLGGKQIKSGLPLWAAKILVGEVLLEAMTISLRANSDKAKKELGWKLKYQTIEAGLPAAIEALQNK